MAPQYTANESSHYWQRYVNDDGSTSEFSYAYRGFQLVGCYDWSEDQYYRYDSTSKKWIPLRGEEEKQYARLWLPDSSMP
jgi:hypothetical protein